MPANATTAGDTACRTPLLPADVRPPAATDPGARVGPGAPDRPATATARWPLVDLVLPASSLPRLAAPGAVAGALSDKARRYLLESGRRQVVAANAAMLAGCVGAGASQGALYLLLDGVGRRLSISPLAAILGVGALEATVTAAGAVWVSHRHEAAGGAGAVGRPGPPPRQLCWVLVGCGAVDILQALCVLGAALGLSAGGLSAAPVLALGILSRAVQSALARVSGDSWQALRPHLAARTAVGSGWRGGTAVALESLWHTACANGAALGSFLVADRRAGVETHLFRWAVSLLTVGASLGAVSKLYFLVEAGRHPAQAADEEEGTDTPPATPRPAGGDAPSPAGLAAV